MTETPAPIRADERPLPAETLVLPKRGWRIDPTHALAAAALCWMTFVLIAWLVHTGRASAIDSLGLILWRDSDNLTPRGPAWLAEAVRDVTALGGVTLRHIFAAGALLALVFLRLRREALVLFGTLLTGLLVELALKALAGRPRPQIVPHLMEAGGMSFPSGHSFNAALVYIAIALAFATFSRRRRTRWTIIGAAVLLSMLVAWSRVWLGVHFPTDVIAGWLGGAGWAFLAEALLQRPAHALAQSTSARP